ncbi:MAG: lysophospholipid acyltransferase family protein [Kiritimatiellae bacterium]|nr:lysophospholipid acyltransferase family protein [Kiritimatiellia bacterium]
MRPYEITDPDCTSRIRFHESGKNSPFTPPSEAQYWATGQFVRFINWQCLNTRKLHGDRLNLTSPAIIAVTHLSHLEPLILSVNTSLAIHWMTRLEFYRKPIQRFLLQRHLTFPVNRAGSCIGTVRYALSLLAAGKVIGIFPEGGVTSGAQAVIRGGPIKYGACLIAQHAQVPVIPVAVIGTHTLNCVPPWLPFRRGNVWLAAGEPLTPPARSLNPREARRQMGARLSASFQALYQELLDQTDLDPEHAP